MTDKVKLVKLNAEQIVLAKRANGLRKQITHAVVCGDYGQLFGTEKQCRKYYSAWSHIFPYLFTGGEEVDNFEFESFETTPELVMVLFDAHKPLEKAARVEEMAGTSLPSEERFAKKKGFWAKLFGM